MGTTFHGPSPWPHITRAIRTRGARYAAIGYLGQDAPALLPLRTGDLLVVNASKAAIRAHATSPAALAYYLNKGVRVLSSPTLHAKVIATNTRTVIGSANASENSTLADDAVVITDDPEIIASVRKFIDSLDEITEVDQVFLDDAILEWEIGRAVPLPGVTGRVRTETDFLHTPVTRMFVKHAVDYEPTRTEQQVLDHQPGRHHSRGGPAAKYQLESLRLDKPSGAKRGDVIIFVSADDEWIHAPAAVVSDPMKIPRSGGAVLYFIRLRTGMSPLPLPSAEKALTDLGHPGSRLRTDHVVRSPSLRSALLGLWNL
ncbi:phosphatidylserine/phosphatidylglycerophosphate/cardiolipin synthase family protein [Rhodococcus sp. WS4]|nr:phosphatidylserine/phosphatidylglycerophosphate/cardiolipin synthase family protein [Rhodococcus sp. WS4]